MIRDVDEPLHANDWLLLPSEINQLRASGLSLPLEEVRGRLSDDNYLFLEGLIPRQDVCEHQKLLQYPCSQRTSERGNLTCVWYF